MVEDDSLRYRTLHRRLLAMWGDSTIFMVIGWFWLVPTELFTSPLLQALGLLGLDIGFYFYRALGHAVSGQTVGKRLAKLRVVGVGGSAITMRQAFTREAVLLAGYAVSFVAMVLYVALKQSTPPPTAVLTVLSVVIFLGFCGDPLFALLNPSRRALHDVLARTVVVRLDVGSRARRNDIR